MLRGADGPAAEGRADVRFEVHSSVLLQARPAVGYLFTKDPLAPEG